MCHTHTHWHTREHIQSLHIFERPLDCSVGNGFGATFARRFKEVGVNVLWSSSWAVTNARLDLPYLCVCVCVIGVHCAQVTWWIIMMMISWSSKALTKKLLDFWIASSVNYGRHVKRKLQLLAIWSLVMDWVEIDTDREYFIREAYELRTHGKLNANYINVCALWTRCCTETHTL